MKPYHVVQHTCKMPGWYRVRHKRTGTVIECSDCGQLWERIHKCLTDVPGMPDWKEWRRVSE